MEALTEQINGYTGSWTGLGGGSYMARNPDHPT